MLDEEKPGDDPAPDRIEIKIINGAVAFFLNRLLEANHLFVEGKDAVRQTFDELKRFRPQYDILKVHRYPFQISTEDQFHSNVSNLIEILGDKASYLWEQTGGKNPDPADPWIVAVAATYGYTVVTNESPRSEMRIPAACRLPKIGCRCIRGPHFLVEVDLVKEIKPEHIDSFDKGQ